MRGIASPSAAAPAQTRSPRLKRRWAIGAAVMLVLVAGAFAAYRLTRMGAVPSSLDYATTRLSEAGLYRVSYAVDGGAIPVNKLHAWTLHVETAEGVPVAGAEIAVDGDMPQHGHGLPTRPRVTQDLGRGDYRVEGMKFQMGGWWVMDFVITAGGQTDKVSFNLSLPK